MPLNVLLCIDSLNRGDESQCGALPVVAKNYPRLREVGDNG